ncbi:hypothetical protein Tco_0613269, partial [Tanacetum coccineum]
MQRLEEEVQWLGESLGEQRILLERMSSDHTRFSTWMVARMTQLMEDRVMIMVISSRDIQCAGSDTFPTTQCLLRLTLPHSNTWGPREGFIDEGMKGPINLGPERPPCLFGRELSQEGKIGCIDDAPNLNTVVDSHADYTSDSNMTPYDQICNGTTPQTVRLPIYKEQVELYERRARFELTEREQKIDEQLRIVICDRNTKEENLKKELHSIKLQLASTIQHNKLMVDEVTSLKKDFNQKENKFLEEFLDLKALKDKVEDKLYKQGQSIQTVHMLCKPRSYYDEVNKVAIGYKNPLCGHRAKQAQPALYRGHVIVTPNHAPAVVRDCEETLELSEISRKKMHDKMKTKECVDNKVNFTPPNYSKENFLATFSPQTTALKSENESLKVQIQNTVSYVTTTQF